MIEHTTEIFIDNAWDPRNHKAILNLCVGFGIKKIYLYHSYNRYEREMYLANEDLNVEDISDLSEFYEQKKQQDFKFIAADFNESAKKTYDFRFPQKSIVVFGAEKLGISPEIKNLCDYTIYIPMIGLVQSYNISVSVGIFCYEIFKQRNL
ncbi:TrmH family RNA methyltransferase [Candidatus Uabimicrobium sp. HlEnr_7]|uniref:TrmH family RNA methyltransferase n=1 Tax=Candidatus Uabimicrobium helgolandensis TaxID=3095367 RepID=UPI0035578CCA